MVYALLISYSVPALFNQIELESWISVKTFLKVDVFLHLQTQSQGNHIAKKSDVRLLNTTWNCRFIAEGAHQSLKKYRFFICDIVYYQL